MSGGEVASLLGAVAGLLAAIAFVVLVVWTGAQLTKLGGVLSELQRSLHELTEHALPVIDEAASLVASSNGQLANVDKVTTAAAEVSQNVSALTALFAATVGRPMLKVAAFSAGVRRAFASRGR